MATEMALGQSELMADAPSMLPTMSGRVGGTPQISKWAKSKSMKQNLSDLYGEDLDVLKEQSRIHGEKITSMYQGPGEEIASIRETIASLRDELSTLRKKQRDDMAAVQKQHRQMNDVQDTIALTALQPRQEAPTLVGRVASVTQRVGVTLGMSAGPDPQPAETPTPRNGPAQRHGSDGQPSEPPRGSPPESTESTTGRRVPAGPGFSSAEDVAMMESAQAMAGDMVRLVVPSTCKGLLAPRSGQLLPRISKDTVTYISLSKKFGAGIHILYIQQLTDDAELVSAAVQCLRLLNPGSRETSAHKLTLLVRRSLVEDTVSPELARSHQFGISISYSPLRFELKQVRAKLLDDEDCEMTMDGEFDRISAYLETLSDKGAFRKVGGAAIPGDEGDSSELGGPVRMDTRASQLDRDETYAKILAMRREKEDVRLQMAQYGLTEESMKDTEHDAIYRARQDTSNTRRGCLLRFITSRPVQVASFFCILINMFVMQFEVDSEQDSAQQEVLEKVQYAITCVFVAEAILNLCVFREIFRFKRIVFDAAVVFLCWVIETMNLAVRDSHTNVTWVLILRLLRFVRFVRMLRNRGGARAIRVITSALLGSALNLIWITALMSSMFYCGAIIFRSMARDQWTSMPEDLEIVVSMYFRDVPTTMFTLIETFLESFDYSVAITRPLCRARLDNSLCWTWISYQVLVKLVIVNLIAGLFIEQLAQSAAQSDETSAKERYAAEHVTFPNIEAVFDLIDQRKEGCFTLNDFFLAWTLKDDVEKLVQIKPAPFYGDYTSFFHFMDAEGVGELCFSDFAYGVITHRCGSKSIDKMILERSSKSVIRQSAATKKSMEMAKQSVEEANKKVWDIDKQVNAQQSQYIRHFGVLQARLDKLKEALRTMFEGLDLGNNSAATQRNLVSVHNIRESRSIMEAMRDLRVEIAKANETAMQQAGAIQNQQVLERFRAEAEAEIARGCDILRKHEAKAINAAQTAARAARAVVKTAQRGLSPDSDMQLQQSHASGSYSGSQKASEQRSRSPSSGSGLHPAGQEALWRDRTRAVAKTAQRGLSPDSNMQLQQSHASGSYSGSQKASEQRSRSPSSGSGLHPAGQEALWRDRRV